MHTVGVNQLAWRAGAGVIAVPLVASWATCPIRSSILVASKLSSCSATCGELEYIIGMGWLVKMAMHPPSKMKTIIRERQRFRYRNILAKG